MLFFSFWPPLLLSSDEGSPGGSRTATGGALTILRLADCNVTAKDLPAKLLRDANTEYKDPSRRRVTGSPVDCSSNPIPPSRATVANEWRPLIYGRRGSSSPPKVANEEFRTAVFIPISDKNNQMTSISRSRSLGRNVERSVTAYIQQLPSHWHALGLSLCRSSSVVGETGCSEPSWSATRRGRVSFVGRNIHGTPK